MKVLKILSCSDNLLWYSNKVGSTVPFLGEEIEYNQTGYISVIYWSREDGGYKNIVYKKDAVVIEVDSHSNNSFFDQNNYPI